ncbi:hypothetical protein F4777DRAFT_584670 [Nemania sp. FL0916]|nr:hypothetical protein F4777DRAFT_584670 [Nemania sp. FL0916]
MAEEAATNGHGPAANGSGPTMNDHNAATNGHGLPTNGHAPAMNGHDRAMSGYGPTTNEQNHPTNRHGTTINRYGQATNAHNPAINRQVAVRNYGPGPARHGYGPTKQAVEREMWWSDTMGRTDRHYYRVGVCKEHFSGYPERTVKEFLNASPYQPPKEYVSLLERALNSTAHGSTGPKQAIVHSFYVTDVDWPYDEADGSMKTTEQRIQDAFHIVQYCLSVSTGAWYYPYRLTIVIISPGLYELFDEAGNRYRLNCEIKGQYSVVYDSSQPKIVKIASWKPIRSDGAA